MNLIQNFSKEEVEINMYCDKLQPDSPPNSQNATHASNICLARLLKKCELSHPIKLRSCDRAYSDCALQAFAKFNRSYDYCQFAFGKHANDSAIYTHGQIANDIRQHENSASQSQMEQCYFNGGDSHFLDYCQDLIEYNYA